MRRTIFILAWWLVLTPIAIQKDVSAAPSEKLRPNIVIILADDYGFDYSFGTAGSAEMNPSTFIENNRPTVIPILSSQEAKEKYGEWYGRDDNIIAKGYSMDRLVPTLSNKACEFVETATRTRPDQPFFLYYAMTTPHNPIVPNREFVGTSRAGAYGDFVVELDHHVGKLLRKIAELGIEKNTIVIFTSDNGPVDRTKGYRENGYMQFAASPEKAPVVWINGDGPFRFQRWFSGEFRIGGSDDLKVFLGQAGVGNSSFCAFQRHVLPIDEPVLATLIYSDAEGNKRQLKCKLKERC